ncbi:PREDICTED: guanine nucleotide-binding protein subunit gamma 1 isoform X2 [Tarenaya hassleriana]|uniref:guanine nucleotide-binding protein subunit gamma 1 isoform X2 n=1 Tax=Tarenaya hassleriana TaxID=28532 RepID=UPI00053C6088|nr:PREDICTED: guanine nucleotide-binding protein subunit gamma 1 isoform X2 [Tarenaya hassleriana]
MAEEMEISAVSAGGGGGKHRILAELARVEQELAFLEKELEELEQTDMVSTVCEETNGPFNMAWDRWFEGPNGAQGCRCLIL